MENSNTHNRKSFKSISLRFIFFFSLLMMYGLTITSLLIAQEYTRGIGVYPGDTKENFSPVMDIDSTTYRNLALLKPAFHSSSYDYNLTAQLITDGIRDTIVPSWISVSSSQTAVINKNNRGWVLDRDLMTTENIDGPNVWVQFEICGGGKIPDADSINIAGSVLINDEEGKGWDYVVSGSDNGKSWEKLGSVNGSGIAGELYPEFVRRWVPKNLRLFNQSFHLKKAFSYRFYRVNCNSLNAISWRIAELALFKQNKQVEIGGPYSFTSAWMSLGNKEEWVYVDLGAVCTFDRIVLYWIRRAVDGSIQVSDDAINWKDIQALAEGSGLTENFSFAQAIKGRYLRVLMNHPASPEGYIISEVEVFGRGGPVASPHPSPASRSNGQIDLAGGAWKVQRASLVNISGESLSIPGYHDNNWVIATVPATVLVSYLNAGALPDPNFGDNQTQISDSYFYSDFWYRTEFISPLLYKDKHVFLNFDGINWKADVYLNGKKLGRIEGAFMRGKFNVSDVLIPGQKNALAVHIEKNATPGYATEQTKLSADANGGQLGADNPTYHAAVGWDWIPTIRGRNTGIWNDVYLTISGLVTIEDPFVNTDLPLPDTSQADVSIEVFLCNHDSKKTEGILRGKFGNIFFEKKVTIKAFETKKVKLDPSTQPALHIQNPKLWWPNGYGDQNLYPVELQFVTNDNQVSDTKSFKAGVRELTYSEDGGVLKIWINGRRFIGRGGNWGFPESMLQYRSREYNAAVRYHKDMNFTMIRNWVGQTGDDEFFAACDKYGIMVWQDFWLANPVDGPNPNDDALFIRNAEDFVKLIRNHPSIALYCGRNEGYPPDILDITLRKILPILHPGLHYISNSAWDVVSGGGPYGAQPVKYYFEKRATTKLHSELGMPNIVLHESLRLMMPDSALWPQGLMWGLHDFCLNGAMRGSSFNQRIEESFGKIDNVSDWLSLAQWINYEGYRAMFEAQGKNRMGLLLWMSHPAWPSLVWQTYDYYLEPTAAYFGCKKASEPLHIQWNAFSDSIEVVNYSSGEGFGLTARTEVLNLDGTVKWEKDSTLDCPEDQILRCFKMQYPTGLTNFHFIRLKLMKGTRILSENFYWRGSEEGNCKVLLDLPKVKPEQETQIVQKDNRWYLTASVTNTSMYPALMIRLKVIREKSKDRILPVIYSDNYISLMPGEKRTVQIELENADTRGEKPQVVIEGINIESNNGMDPGVTNQ